MTTTLEPPSAKEVTGASAMESLRKVSPNPPNNRPPAAKTGSQAFGQRGQSFTEPPPSIQENEAKQADYMTAIDRIGRPSIEPLEPETPTAAEAPPEKPAAPTVGDELEIPGSQAEQRSAPAPASEELPPTSTIDVVRKAHKEQLKRARALEAELAELKKAPPVAPSKELDELKVKAAASEARLREVDYTRTEEFSERYTKPIADALTAAYTDVQELTVTTSEGDRKATNLDFIRIARLPLQEASVAAREMFGDMAGEVLAHRRTYLQHVRARDAAIAEASKLSEESQTRQQQQQTERREKLMNSYKSKTATLSEKLPQYFKEKDGDDEANSYLRKGMALVDKMANDPNLTDDQRVDLLAHLNLRAAAMPRVALELQRALAREAALEAKLKGYEKSVPNGSGPIGNREAPHSVESTLDSFFDTVNKRS